MQQIVEIEYCCSMVCVWAREPTIQT